MGEVKPQSANIPGGGILGRDTILWEIRMQYPWNDQLADAEPDWDQCCTLWQYGTSPQEAVSKAWAAQHSWNGGVLPESVASCVPLRFEAEPPTPTKERPDNDG